jgi:multiple sugar transport system permease protein
MTATAAAGRPRQRRTRSLSGLNLRPPDVRPGMFWLVRVAMLWALALFFGLPVLWLVLAPSKTNAQLASAFPLSFGSFGNYATAFEHILRYGGGVYVSWLENSFVYVGASVAIALVLALTAGYALAVFEFPGRRAILIATLIAMITPSAATVLPLFLEMSLFHLLNTAFSVILPSGFFPFGVYLSYVYFTTSLPKEILESARVDGTPERTIFVRVALPLAKPLISLVTFFAFVAQWNNFYLVAVMISSESRFNLQVGMSTFLSGAFFANPGVPIDSGILRPELALGGMILAAPVVLLFLLIQRYLIRGLLAGYGVG